MNTIIKLGKKNVLINQLHYLIFLSTNWFWFIFLTFHQGAWWNMGEGLEEGKKSRPIHSSTFMECLIDAKRCARSWDHGDK